jgi:hypothetical protein
VTGLSGVAHTAVAALPGAAAEPVLEAKFHFGWSEPARPRIPARLAIALVASGVTFVPAPPFQEIVTEDRWHQAWSEPIVKRKPRLAEAHQQFLAWQPAPSPFVATGWFNWLSEPVRLKPALPAGGQQFLAPDPKPLVAFSWFDGLTEPVRTRPALPVFEQHVFELEPAPIIAIAWHLPLSEPVRVRAALPAGEQQFYGFDEDIIFVDRWFAWWSEPARVRPALATGRQQVLAFDPQPFPFLGGGGGWYLPDPTRPPSEEPAQRRVKKQGAPRQVEPAIVPPTFKDTIAAQQPARLADVLGSAFVPRLEQREPPALDLYTPAPRPISPRPVIAPAVTDAAADHVDAIDAMEALQALDGLEQQEREAVIAVLLRIASSE